MPEERVAERGETNGDGEVGAVTAKLKLDWGETPWDNLTREELLREVQRYHSALESAASVMRMCSFSSGQHEFWTAGSGGRATEKAAQVKARLDGFNAEAVYRSFFRYADDLLFSGLGNDWRICDQCGVMTSQIESPKVGPPRLCHDCKRKGVDSVMRPITWDDLKPKGEGT